MSPTVTIVLAAVAAYVAGATPFGFLTGKLRGVDIREHGSGNIGATNVLRIVGKPYGVIVLILDVLKGFLPVYFGRMFCESQFPPGSGELLDIATVIIALATTLGHNYTFWLGFKGGKGIATSAGALLGIMPWAILIAVAVWLILYYSTRYVAVASMGGAVTVPIAIAILGATGDGISTPHLILGLLMAFFGLWRHRSNIKNLLAGTEHKFEKKSKAHEESDSPS